MVPIEEEGISRVVTEGNTVRVKGRVKPAVLRFTFICDWSGVRAAGGRGDRGSVDVASRHCVGVSAEPVLKVVKFSFVCCEPTAVTRCFPVLYQPGVFRVKAVR